MRRPAPAPVVRFSKEETAALVRALQGYFDQELEQKLGDIPAQMLLDFAEELDRQPVAPDDVPPAAEPVDELRRVRRRPGRRNLANFENLPLTTHVHELSAGERACPCCGTERKEIGADESWQVEYIPGRFERIQHHCCPKQDRPVARRVESKRVTGANSGFLGGGLRFEAA